MLGLTPSYGADAVAGERCGVASLPSSAGDNIFLLLLLLKQKFPHTYLCPALQGKGGGGSLLSSAPTRLNVSRVESLPFGREKTFFTFLLKIFKYAFYLNLVLISYLSLPFFF